MLSAVDGQCAVCSVNADDSDTINDPQYGENWDLSRAIRSDVIEWLCKHGSSFGRSPSSSIYVYGAKVSGQLNLSYAVIVYPLLFERCVFVEDMSFKNAKVPSLILTGSWVRTILADGIDVANNVLLNKQFCSRGQVLLRDAKIGGNLRTEDARFQYEPGSLFGQNSNNSLGCDRIKVSGNIFLSKPGHRSTFIGEVGLAGSFIGGNLECDGSLFENRGGASIRADRINVVGSIFLRDGFLSQGTVRLVNAQMNLLDCSRGTFEGNSDTTLFFDNSALNAEGATISSWAVFRGTVIKRGDVLLRGVKTGDITFHAAELLAVDLRYATIRRALRIKKAANPQLSDWDLREASTDSVDDDQRSWPNPGNLHVDGLTYESFGSIIEDPHDDSTPCPKDLHSRLQWIELDTSNPPQAYSQLAHVYSTAGETATSRNIRYRLEDMLHRRQIEAEKCYVLKAAWWLWRQSLKLTIGYGYRLWRSLYWLVPIAVLGWAISYIGYYAKVIVPTDKDAYLHSAQYGYVPNHYPRFSATMFTIEHSLPAIDLGMSSSWSADGSPQSAEHPCFANGVRIWLWVQRLLGWLLSIFFVAGITGLVKSDK
jgi:hypothetical protein